MLTDCISALEEGDGRSGWNAEPNSQLRLEKTGFYCLTQQNVHGSEPGVGDVAASFGASAHCDSSAGQDHQPSMALDRDVNTFWASGSFPDAAEHLVVFDIDLGNAIEQGTAERLTHLPRCFPTGKKARLAGIRIDWEYPALAYKVQVSEDGKEYS